MKSSMFVFFIHVSVCPIEDVACFDMKTYTAFKFYDLWYAINKMFVYYELLSPLPCYTARYGAKHWISVWIIYFNKRPKVKVNQNISFCSIWVWVLSFFSGFWLQLFVDRRTWKRMPWNNIKDVFKGFAIVLKNLLQPLVVVENGGNVERM